MSELLAVSDEIREGSHMLHILLHDSKKDDEPMGCPSVGQELRVILGATENLSIQGGNMAPAAPGVLQVAISASIAGSESDYLSEHYKALYDDVSLPRPSFAKFSQRQQQARATVNQKRDSLKGFKQSIAAMIEQGEVVKWIATVTKEELINRGGEANRLFQLLDKGEKAKSLVDSIALANAANRTDLFSAKQCATLQERSSEVEALAIAETERLVKEEEQRMVSTGRACRVNPFR